MGFLNRYKNVSHAEVAVQPCKSSRTTLVGQTHLNRFRCTQFGTVINCPIAILRAQSSSEHPLFCRDLLTSSSLWTAPCSRSTVSHPRHVSSESSNAKAFSMFHYRAISDTQRELTVIDIDWEQAEKSLRMERTVPKFPHTKHTPKPTASQIQLLKVWFGNKLLPGMFARSPALFYDDCARFYAHRRGRSAQKVCSAPVNSSTEKVPSLLSGGSGASLFATAATKWKTVYGKSMTAFANWKVGLAVSVRVRNGGRDDDVPTVETAEAQTLCDVYGFISPMCTWMAISASNNRSLSANKEKVWLNKIVRVCVHLDENKSILDGKLRNSTKVVVVYGIYNEMAFSMSIRWAIRTNQFRIWIRFSIECVCSPGTCGCIEDSIASRKNRIYSGKSVRL